MPLLSASTVHARMSTCGVPGLGVAIIGDGRVIEEVGYGVREIGRTEQVLPGTLFQACSISKAVTAVAVLRLVREGRLLLDDAVNTYLASWRVRDTRGRAAQVTVRQLLSHTAGTTLPWTAGYHPAQEIPTLSELLDGDKPSNYPAIRVAGVPGARFEYSAGGYCVLQQLVVDVTGQPFPAAMRELILAPLRMEQSTFEQPLPAQWEADAATGHRATGKPVAGRWRVYPEMAAAGLWTTPADLARMAIDLHAAYSGATDALLSPELASTMLTRQVSAADSGSMGLGVFLSGAGHGQRYGHPGDNEGYACQWTSVLGTGDGAVAMTNSDLGWSMLHAIMDDLAAACAWP